MENEEETEEILIYVQCENENINNVKDMANLKIIGLDTEQPIMSLNGKFYEGNYEDAVGTYLFFENEKNSDEADPFEPNPSLKYVAKTRKVLQMQRVFVMPKKENGGNQDPKENQDNRDVNICIVEDLEGT